MFVRSGIGSCALLISMTMAFASTIAFTQDATPPASQPAGVANSQAQGVLSSTPGPLAVRDQTRYVLSPGDVLEARTLR